MYFNIFKICKYEQEWALQNENLHIGTNYLNILLRKGLAIIFQDIAGTFRKNQTYNHSQNI